MLVLGINTKEEIWLNNEVVLSFRRQTTGSGWKILIEAPRDVQVTRKPRSLDSGPKSDQELPEMD